MKPLQGGREGKIFQNEQHVHRPAGFWSPAVHSLLAHLHTQNVTAVPKPIGFDEAGNEIVSYIHGEVSNYPLSADAKSVNALESAARLLRQYHDATVSFLNSHTKALSWQLPIRYPAEVICHGDYAPYNVVLDGETAVGIIDFDTAHPAPRNWDIAYALYRWAPFTNPTNQDGFGDIEAQIIRAKIFCDAYDLPTKNRNTLPETIIERLQVLVNFMVAEAENGNEAFQQNIEDGHHLLYLNDIEYMMTHQSHIQKGLI